MSNYQDPNVPPYGTPEYAEWYQRNVLGQQLQPPKKKGHKVRWTIVGVAVAAVVGGIASAAASSGNSGTTGHASRPTQPAAAPTHHKTKAPAGSDLDQVPSDPPTSDDSSDTAMGTPIGQTITVTETEFDGSKDVTDVTVNSVSSHSHAGDDPDPMFDPKNGRFAVVNVTIKCVSGDCAYNPLYFGWQEADGTTYAQDDGNGIYAGYQPELSSGDLSTGQIKRGNVGFDVPLTAGAQVTLSSPDGTEVGSWK